jgi:hypothetical protein
MLIILLVWTLVFLAGGFVIFVLALMGGVVGLWSGWLAMRSHSGKVSNGGKDEIIALLIGLLFLIVCSPVLFVVTLIVMANM